jgi:hypothetical protein
VVSIGIICKPILPAVDLKVIPVFSSFLAKILATKVGDLLFFHNLVLIIPIAWSVDPLALKMSSDRLKTFRTRRGGIHY